MSILNLWPLYLLLTIPFLVLLYILKQKSEDKIISSSLLWNQVYRNIQANTPFEKLRKNIMLFVQLLIIILLITALMHPFLKYFGKNYSSVIVVIDNSASMSAKYDDLSRLERAKELAKEYVNSYPQGTNVSLISCSNKIDIDVTSSKDNMLVNRKIASISQKYVKGNLQQTMSLITSMTRELKEYEVLFLTDETINIGDINGKLISLSNEGSNISIDNMAHIKEGEAFKVIATITNRGNTTYSGDFSIYGEENLIDVRTIDLEGGESSTINFNIKDFDGAYFKGEISGEDIIKEDNIFYDGVKEQGNKRILLASNNNIFLEKALMTLPGVEIIKTADINNISEEDKFDLYIYDGILGQYVPQNGNLLLINAPSNEMFKVDGTIQGGESKLNKEEIPDYLKSMNFITSKMNKVEAPNWAKSIINIKDSSALFLGKYKGQSIGALNFDIHNSDLPLKAEFPILIHYICNELLPDGIVRGNNFLGGDTISIKGNPLVEKVVITTPSKKEINLKPHSEFNTYSELGVYRVQQKDKEVVNRDIFTINFPSKEEGNTATENIEGKTNNITQVNGIKSGIDLTPFIIFIILSVVIIEWYLYRKGY